MEVKDVRVPPTEQALLLIIPRVLYQHVVDRVVESAEIKEAILRTARVPYVAGDSGVELSES